MTILGLTVDPTVQAALIAFVGVILGLLGSAFSNFISFRHQRKQWEREHRANEEEQLKNKLQEIYTNCIYFIDKKIYSGFIPYDLKQVSGLEYYKLDFEARKLDLDNHKELQKWLSLLSLNYPQKNTKEHEEFLAKMRESKLTKADIINIAENDPRL